MSIKMTSTNDVIKEGDYIVIQRQTFMKLHKLKSNGTVSLGKDQVELETIIGKSFFSTFRMVARPKNRRVYTLEEADYVSSLNLNVDKSGADNRDIIDDGSSQQLSTEEITKFRDEALSSSDIVEKLVNNSKTFSTKTEYSQEKYLKKKEKKYFEYIQIRKPTLRLITEIYYRQDPGKILGLRIDDLSQILMYSNIQDCSNILLYDSGTSGLLPAAIVNAVGSNTNGLVVHMHPGNVCQKEAFLALQFPEEQKERCINVCLYSVLRCFYQNQQGETEKHDTNKQMNEETLNKSKIEEKLELATKRKLNDDDGPDKKIVRRPCWQIDNERACKILIDKVDSLIIVAKEHPSNIVNELLSFLKMGKSFVVFSLLREILENLYIELKMRTDVISLRLSNNMMRNYQILPNRTHPDVTMTSSGYILTGIKVSTNLS